MTKNHVILNNLSKMKFKFATQVNKNNGIYYLIKYDTLVSIKKKYLFKLHCIVQIFSKSMAVGIRFYRNKEKELFKNSEETEDFTPMINNLFDALNRKYSVEGIPNGSKDFEVFNLKQNVVLHVFVLA